MTTVERTAQKKGSRAQADGDARGERKLPPKEEALELLDKMLLIRHFEERAQEMYMKAKIGGFLHLAVGEEATVVGTTSALQPRERSMKGFSRPCTSGPSAVAPARRSVSL